ncbi:MAG: asparagine synthase (glutamine-hydrolyzing) [Verrucomicrobiales bacterium]|nr:asparagine synthase (glutamine-hydrolyzing) [Verrucomicrobiales bacterium]
MCGISGFLTSSPERSSERLRTDVRRMTDAMVRRGPDDEGAWVDEACGVALGHRRLSILDLSSAGHQPMCSTSGRFVIVFNGEIYNFKLLRVSLEEKGHAFEGHSDTELMLAAIEEWGIQAATQRFNGMFAFAVWDREERTLTLGRDRLGEKPLYYGQAGDAFVFSSELKTLRGFPGFEAEIDRSALTALLRYNYIPDPWCIYQGLHKLPPGTLLTLRSPTDLASPEPYWSLRQVVTRGTRHPFNGTSREAIDAFDALLQEAVESRMIADVPLGAFLSGGVDSSLIVALMQARGSQPVKTFTIGFHEKEYNEAGYAKAVAAHLGTDHTELYVTGQDALDVIPLLPDLYDEPFSDYSQIPTYLVCKMARQHVTVALSGDAGDELFGGYERYAVGRKLWNSFARLPQPARQVAAALMRSMPASAINTLARLAGPVLPSRFRHVAVGDKMHKLAEVVAAPGLETLYLNLMSHWKRPEQIVMGGEDRPTVITDRSDWPEVADFTHRMMHLDMETYLPGDILTKVDRAAMGVSLETRVPLLDPNVIEFAWTLPPALKVQGGQGKWLMKQTLDRYVPRALMDRPKRGFGIPLDAWLRGPLRDWAEDLLSEERLRREGYFHPAPIREKWREHLSGTRNWHFYLWDVLMFQAWLNRAG